MAPSLGECLVLGRLEIPAQDPARAGKLALGGPGLDSKDLGDVVVGIPLDVVQHQDHAVAGGECSDRLLQVEALRRVAGSRLGDVRDIERRQASAPAQRLAGAVERDPREPGAKLRAPGKPLQPLDRADPGLLEDILRGLVVSSGEAPDEGEEGGRVTPVELTERLLVAPGHDEGYECPVVGARRGRVGRPQGDAAAGSTKSLTTTMILEVGRPGSTTIPEAIEAPPTSAVVSQG